MCWTTTWCLKYGAKENIQWARSSRIARPPALQDSLKEDIASCTRVNWRDSSWPCYVMMNNLADSHCNSINGLHMDASKQSKTWVKIACNWNPKKMSLFQSLVFCILAKEVSYIAASFWSKSNSSWITKNKMIWVGSTKMADLLPI